MSKIAFSSHTFDLPIDLNEDEIKSALSKVSKPHFKFKIYETITYDEFQKLDKNRPIECTGVIESVKPCRVIAKDGETNPPNDDDHYWRIYNVSSRGHDGLWRFCFQADNYFYVVKVRGFDLPLILTLKAAKSVCVNTLGLIRINHKIAEQEIPNLIGLDCMIQVDAKLNWVVRVINRERLR